MRSAPEARWQRIKRLPHGGLHRGGLGVGQDYARTLGRAPTLVVGQRGLVIGQCRHVPLVGRPVTQTTPYMPLGAERQIPPDLPEAMAFGSDDPLDHVGRGGRRIWFRLVFLMFTTTTFLSSAHTHARMRGGGRGWWSFNEVVRWGR